MDTESKFVGLDYHQLSVQVCVMNGDGQVLSNRSLENQLCEIVDDSGQHGAVADVAIEACGGASDLGEKERCLEGLAALSSLKRRFIVPPPKALPAIPMVLSLHLRARLRRNRARSFPQCKSGRAKCSWGQYLEG